MRILYNICLIRTFSFPGRYKYKYVCVEIILASRHRLQSHCFQLRAVCSLPQNSLVWRKVNNSVLNITDIFRNPNMCDQPPKKLRKLQPKHFQWSKKFYIWSQYVESLPNVWSFLLPGSKVGARRDQLEIWLAYLVSVTSTYQIRIDIYLHWMWKYFYPSDNPCLICFLKLPREKLYH